MLQPEQLCKSMLQSRHTCGPDLRCMSCAPAWPPSPEKRTRSAAGAAMAVTMPSNVPFASSSGPCSMCSCARQAAGL